MSISIGYLTAISKLVDQPESLKEALVRAIDLSRPIAIAEYQREAPVDKGLLRSKVYASPVWVLKDKIEYKVRSLANNRGFPYPIALVQGTGIFKGSESDSPSTGRVRSGESQQNRGSGGIRPNMFPMRAAKKGNDKINRFVTIRLGEEMAKLTIKQYES